MNRFAPPASDQVHPSFRLGLPGRAAATIVVAYLAFVLPNDPGFSALLKSGSLLPLFLSLGPLANLLLLVGVLLLVFRLPSSTLLFAAALTAGLADVLRPPMSASWWCVLVAMCGLAASLVVFLGPRMVGQRAREA